MTFSLRIGNTAKGQIRRLDQSLQRRMVVRFDQLCANPLSSPLSDWVEGADALRKTQVVSYRVPGQLKS